MEPPKKETIINAYFQPNSRWAEPLALLRELLLFSGLVEDFKWGKPTYTHNGENTAILFEFKDSCAIGFFKGALLKDEAKILVAPGEHSQAMRMAKFTRACQGGDFARLSCGSARAQRRGSRNCF